MVNIEITIIKWKIIKHKSVKKNQYKISPYGDIKNIRTGKKLKGAIDKDGYLVYGLPNRNGKIKTRKAHRLVAFTFLKESNYFYVNHKNGNKLNNYYKNLEWCDIKYNNKHARDTGLNNITGENNPYSKFKNDLINEICILISEGYTNKQIIDITNIPSKSKSSKHSLISSIRHRKSWISVSKVYHW